MATPDSIEVTGDEELSNSGLVANLRYNALKGGGVACREVAAHHVPDLPAYNHLESDDVWYMMLVFFYHKVRGLFVIE